MNKESHGYYQCSIGYALARQVSSWLHMHIGQACVSNKTLPSKNQGAMGGCMVTERRFKGEDDKDDPHTLFS